MSGSILRIVARRVPWPDPRGGSRSGLRLRWDAMTEDGELLVAATEYPLADGAHVLLSRHGARADAPVTMRHAGSTHDSFKPAPLHVVAVAGARRADDLAALARRRDAHRRLTADAAVGEAEVAAGDVVAPVARVGAPGQTH